MQQVFILFCTPYLVEGVYYVWRHHMNRCELTYYSLFGGRAVSKAKSTYCHCLLPRIHVQSVSVVLVFNIVVFKTTQTTNEQIKLFI